MTALSTRKTIAVATSMACIGLLSAGCAVSDYRGYLGHMTESEAKLWGSQIAFDIGDPNYNGTYEYTVKYDFRALRALPPPAQCPIILPNPPAACTYPDVIDLFTYRNPTFAAFSRDGCVDRDGDELQQRPGAFPFRCDLPLPSDGKFEPFWEFEDGNAGCQFFANYKKTYSSPKVTPLIAECRTLPSEEVDKDLSLQGSAQSNLKEQFASLDDLFGKIWSGVLGTSFTAEIAAVTVNGTRVPLSQVITLGFVRNDFRPINVTIDLTGAGGKDFIRALLANTTDGAPATLSFHLDGGLTISVPSSWILAFNHEALQAVL
jgi:hypothetical protein